MHNRKFLFIIMLLFSVTSCVPVYQPIDAIDIYEQKRVEVVYVPQYRPSPLYFYNGWWYDEPYTYITYQDLRGRIYPRRIPKSIMRDIDRRMLKKTRPTIIRPRPKQISPQKNRIIIRKRTKKRK